MKRIVGMMGAKRSGKDTIGEFLAAEGWTRLSFAALLYEEISHGYGVTVERLQHPATKDSPQPWLALKHCSNWEFIQTMLALEPDADREEAMNRPRSPREILQKWGTEYRREKYRSDYWTAPIKEKILANPESRYVITDVRLENEIALIKDLGGVTARVIRPAQNLDQNLDPGLKHSSEQLWRVVEVDMEFINLEGLENLQKLRKEVIEFVDSSQESDEEKLCADNRMAWRA